MRGNARGNTTRKFTAFRAKEAEMNKNDKNTQRDRKRSNNKVSALVPAAGQGHFICLTHFILGFVQTSSQKILRLKQWNVRTKRKTDKYYSGAVTVVKRSFSHVMSLFHCREKRFRIGCI